MPRRPLHLRKRFLAPSLALGLLVSAVSLEAQESDAGVATIDPRLPLVSLLFEGRDREALQAARRLLESEPQAASWGLEYLRGHLLEEMERHEEASQAFAAALNRAPRLADRARLHLARSQERLGHPEVAAGLLATLLASEVAEELERPASELLLSALKRGGDCRLLGKAVDWPLAETARRLISFARAECALRVGDPVRARELLGDLLSESIEDAAARLAADRLAGLGPLSRESALRVGLTFHEHREFERATRHLSTAFDGDDGHSRLRNEEYDAHYALGRSLFWRGFWEEAADVFANLAGRSSGADVAARARYQQGRSLELAGDWNGAARAFGLAWEAEPTGSFSGAALLSTLRLRWRSGKEEEALPLYEQLGHDRRWRDNQRRAALFLASSDLVRGRSDRAAGWLATAASGTSESNVEAAYWLGRLAELQGLRTTAVARYLEAVEDDPYHPIAQAAAIRLLRPELAAAARLEARRRAERGRPDELYRAWLLTRGTAESPEYSRRLLSELAAQPRVRPYLAIAAVPPEKWSLWREGAAQGDEELLLRIGLWGEAEEAVRRHFPLDEPNLALTGSRLLGLGGLPHRSLYVAEVLRDRVPADLPPPFLPVGLRLLLYPLPWADRIAGEARRQGIEIELLAAVIREESRFDADAVSAAQARGLTQFVYPTARQMAAEIGLGEIEPRDLGDPAVAIALGAAYLAQLRQRFAGHTAMALAAYNAGEPQADLWRVYCYSREPEEYYTKVGFTETRGYLRKVLASRAQYLEIYSGR